MTNVWFDLAEVSVGQHWYWTVRPYTIHGQVLIILSILFAIILGISLLANSNLKSIINFKLKYYKFLKVVKQECGDSVPFLAIFHSFDSDSLLETLISQNTIQLDYPGRYGIHCLVTNRTYFCSTINVIGEIESDLYKIENHLFEYSDDLIEDLSKYSFYNFIFIIFDIFPKFNYKESKDFDEMDNKYERIENIWPFKLY